MSHEIRRPMKTLNKLKFVELQLTPNYSQDWVSQDMRNGQIGQGLTHEYVQTSSFTLQILDLLVTIWPTMSTDNYSLVTIRG